MTPRQETLAWVEKQSAAEYERLLKARADNEIYYDPQPGDIYVYQLEVSDRNGQRPFVYSNFFATHDAALRYAMEVIKANYLVGVSALGEDMQAMYDEGRHEELLEYVNSHLWHHQKISMIRVQA